MEAGSDETDVSPSSSVGDMPAARWGWQETHHVAIYSHTSLAAALEALEAEGDHDDQNHHGDYTQPRNEEEPPMEVRLPS